MDTRIGQNQPRAQCEHYGRTAGLWIAASVAVGLVLSAPAAQPQHEAIYFGKSADLVKRLTERIGTFGVTCHGVLLAESAAAVDKAELAKRLDEVQLVLSGQYIGDTLNVVLADQDVQAAFSRFLTRGGTLFFDYNGLPGGGACRTYLEQIGVIAPTAADWDGVQHYWSAILPAGPVHPLLASPNRFEPGELPIRGFAYWTDVSEQQTALLRPNIAPDAAGLVLQQNVLGKGTVVFNRAFSIWRSSIEEPDTPDARLVANLMFGVFGTAATTPTSSEAAPIGQRHAVWDRFDRRAVNRAWAAELAGKPWWHEAWRKRVPMLVHEPIGQRRFQATVSVLWPAPEGTGLSSVQVVTPYGEALPTQALAAQDGRIEVLFFVDELAPYEHVPLFLYHDGGQTEALRAPVTDVAAAAVGSERWERNYRLENESIVVELARDGAVLRSIRAKGGCGRNQVPNFGKTMGQGSSRFGPTDPCESNIVDTGPLRVGVEYRGEGWRFRCWLYRASSLLHFEGTRDTGTEAGSWQYRIWLPGGDGVNDSFLYETDDGVYEIALTADTYHPFKVNFLAMMKEGWYAAQDTVQGETVGEFFDREDVRSLKVSEHFQGNRWQTAYSLGSDPVGGALICVKGGWRDVRDAYIAWKNPPEVLVGSVQARDDVPPAKVPEWGRDSIRIIPYSYKWYEATRMWGGTPAEVARAVVSEVLRIGANYVNISGGSGTPIWASRWRKDTRYHAADWLMLEPLVDEAHRRGVGVRLALHGMPVYCTPEGEKPCIVRDHDLHMAAYREIAGLGLDAFCPLCEPVPPIQSEAANRRFQAEYGKPFQGLSGDILGALASAQAVDELRFRTTVLREYIRDMCEVFSSVDPGVITAVSASPNNLGKLNNFYDFEGLHGHIDSPSMDLYGTQPAFLRYWIAYLRGLGANGALPRKAVHCWTGCSRDRDEARLNQYLHLLFGDPYPMFFTYTGYKNHPEMWEEIRNCYRFMDYTGFGRSLVQSPPMKFVAVYRDRGAFIDSVKRREAVAGGVGGTTAYTRRVSERLLMANVPTDMVLTQDLSADALRAYSFVFIPSDPVLSDADVQQFRLYAENGGHLVVEGECLRNGMLAELAGVRPSGAAQLGGQDVLFRGKTVRYRGRVVALALADDVEVLATMGGAPAMVRRTVGSGSVISIGAETVSNELVRELLLSVGPLPVGLPADAERSLIVNVFSDEAPFTVGVYNRLNDRVDTELTLSLPLGPGTEHRVLDLSTGELRPLQGQGLMLALEPREVRFLVVGAADGVRLPELAALATGGTHSRRAGMAFLRIRDVAASTASAPARVKEEGKVYVGIFRGEGSRRDRPFAKGAVAIHRALSDRRDLVVEHLPDLSTARLAQCDVVIIPNMGHPGTPTNLNADWQRAVRAFVDSGGGVLVCQHAVGMESYFPALFPDVATVKNYVPLREMEVVESHPVASGESLRRRYPRQAENPAFSEQFEVSRMQPGDVFTAGFNDYDCLIPGPRGKTVVRSVRDTQQGLGDDPVVVVGQVGKGRVVLSGMTLGYTLFCTDGEWVGPFDELTEGEGKLLTNSVFWLADRE